MFLPPSIQEWLPEQHLARFVVEIVEQLELSEITGRYAGSGGQRAYHPAMLVALLFYGYATGVFSSRKLEQATYDGVSRSEHPDHDTIANFRKRFLDELQGLFKQILVLAQALGVLRMGRVSLDGTKVQGNASKHKAMSWGHVTKLERQLEGEVQTLLGLAERADQGEQGEQEQQELDIRIGAAGGTAGSVREAKEKIKERAQERDEAERAEYEAKLKRRQEREEASGKKVGGRPPKEPEAGPKEDQVNLTDEESRIMPGQTVHTVSTRKPGQSHGSGEPRRGPTTEPALNELAKVAEELGKPEALVADAGYHSKENVDKSWSRRSSRILRGAENGHWESA